MVTHGNLLHNLRAIRRAGGEVEDPGCVSWLPPYHDMGLIGGILFPIYQSFPATLMSPLHFLQRPFRWPSALSRYRGTHSAAPSFAYDLCVRKTTPEQRAALDLRRWHISFNGAEPVSPRGLLRFTEAFAPAGLRPTTLFPCYGLAEATLIASGGRAQERPVIRSFQRRSVEEGRAEPADDGEDGAALLVGCGASIDDQRIAVVDPETRAPLAEGEVGEIWLSGPSVARGYWNRPEETAATFGASLDGWPARLLRTGDLGFLLGGQLFVTGRRKDLLIVAGQNHYPQDLERSAEASSAALRPGASAAFSVPLDEQEQVVIAVEVEGAPDAAALEEIPPPRAGRRGPRPPARAPRRGAGAAQRRATDLEREGAATPLPPRLPRRHAAVGLTSIAAPRKRERSGPARFRAPGDQGEGLTIGATIAPAHVTR